MLVEKGPLTDGLTALQYLGLKVAIGRKDRMYRERQRHDNASATPCCKSADTEGKNQLQEKPYNPSNTLLPLSDDEVTHANEEQVEQKSGKGVLGRVGG